MKKHYLKLLVLLLVSISTYGQNIKFTDANFKKALLDHKNPVVDINKDGEISITEAEEVTRLNLLLKGIINLKEISYFINLKDLDCSSNRLSSLDVSENTQLRFLRCGSNSLSSLNVSNNMLLKSIYCSDNRLYILDVSKNIELERLGCMNNDLEKLDISNNSKLKGLACSGNKLSILDVSKNIELEVLSCGNNQLKTLEVRKAKLKNIYFENNPLLITAYLTSPLLDKDRVKFENCPNLNFICVDNSQVDNFEKLCEKYNYTNCNVSSSCTLNVRGEKINKPLTKVKFKDYFKLYPNPTTHILNIEPIEDDIKVKFIYIYNNYGSLVAFFHGTVKQLNLDFLVPEYYHLRLETDKGMLSAPFLIKR